MPEPDLSVDGPPREECGVFGVWAPGEDVAKLTYYGLYALQHRGQEAAGIAVSDGAALVVYKDLGLVAQVFDEPTLDSLRGHIAIGHMPLLHHRLCDLGERAAHVPDHADRDRHRARPQRQPGQHRRPVRPGREAGRRRPARRDHRLGPDHQRCSPRTRTCRWRRPRARCCRTLSGAFSLVFMDEHTLYAARDGYGVRPLVLGRLDRGWVVASETAALDIVGASFVREVEPGELITIDARRAALGALRPADAEGLPVRVRVPGPAGHDDRRSQRALGPGRGRPPAGPRAPGRGRPGHPGAGVRHPRRDRLRRGVRHPVRPGPGEELLRRPDLHPAVPDDPAARHPAQAQSAAGRAAGQADRRGGRLDRARQHPARAGPDAARVGCAGGARPDLRRRR